MLLLDIRSNNFSQYVKELSRISLIIQDFAGVDVQITNLQAYSPTSFFHLKNFFTFYPRNPSNPRHPWSWRISESNRWPLACKANALANWANPPSSAVALAKAGFAFNLDPKKELILIDHLRQGFGGHSRPEQIWTADPYIISVVL